MTSLPYILDERSITLVISGQPVTIDKDNEAYHKIILAIKDDDWEKVVQLSSKKQQVKEFVKGKLELKGNAIYYDDVPVHNSIVKKVLSFIDEGLDATPLLNFLEKLMHNPSRRCVLDLYDFLEFGNMPIDPDGDFYAYKAVRPDWKDKYSGTLDNSIGAKVSVPRNLVDDDPANACSHGLHAGSISYVNSFAGPGDIVIIVKINPANVVSVPSHDKRKLRCCEYEVVREYEGLLPNNTYSYEEADDDYDDPDLIEDELYDDDNNDYQY